MHKCIQCNALFDPNKFFYDPRPFWRKYFPRPGHFEEDVLDARQNVRCPNCGKIQHSDQVKYFGLFTRRVYKNIVVFILLIVIGKVVWDIFHT